MNFSFTNVLIIILSVVTLINLILLAVNNIRLKKYKKLYEKALAKFNSTENINDEFNSLYERLNEAENKVHSSVEGVDMFGEKLSNNVQKIGFVKYNAYDETENKLSFAIALLDGNDSGILINHIYSKHGSNMYAKLVINGKVEDRISEQEQLAIKQAMEDKVFKERKVILSEKGTKIKRNKT